MHWWRKVNDFFWQLRKDDSCAVVGEDHLPGMGKEPVKMINCVSHDENQQWIHTKQGRLIHKLTNKCLGKVLR